MATTTVPMRALGRESTRRTVLTAATAAIAIAAVPPAVAAQEPDPAFALIKAHQSAEQRYNSLADTDPAMTTVGMKTTPALQAELDQLSDEEWNASWSLADCKPTTLQGIAAVLRYVAIDDDGARWPVAGESDENWQRTLHENLAAALERLVR